MGAANRLFMVIGISLVICYAIAQVRPSHENLVRVEMNGLRNDGGQMMGMLCSWAKDFPKQADRVISEPPPELERRIMQKAISVPRNSTPPHSAMLASSISKSRSHICENEEF